MNNENNNVPNTQASPQPVVLNQSVQTQAVQAQPQVVAQPQPVQQSVQQPVQQPVQPQPVPQKKKSHTGLILSLFIIICLGGACFFLYQKWMETEDYYLNYYSPINSKTETKLDLESPVIVDLYNKFKTDESEDYFGKDINQNDMKLYLALRNVSYNYYLDSNCNKYDNTKMQSFNCPNNYTTKAIDENIVKEELIKLYGENHDIQLNDVTLGNSCYGGYQYIQERKQFVLGRCIGNVQSRIKTEKKLLEATTTDTNIVIKEKVRYYSTSIDVPDYLKDGTYIYKFRLDNNYNYIFVSKEYSEGTQ